MAPFTADGPMEILPFHRNCTSQSHGMAGNRKAGGFMNRTVICYIYMLYMLYIWSLQRPFARSQPIDIFSVLHGTAGNHGAGSLVNSAVKGFSFCSAGIVPVGAGNGFAVAFDNFWVWVACHVFGTSRIFLSLRHCNGSRRM